jgi:hypothetical protein
MFDTLLNLQLKPADLKAAADEKPVKPELFVKAQPAELPRRNVYVVPGGPSGSGRNQVWFGDEPEPDVVDFESVYLARNNKHDNVIVTVPDNFKGAAKGSKVPHVGIIRGEDTFKINSKNHYGYKAEKRDDGKAIVHWYDFDKDGQDDLEVYEWLPRNEWLPRK